MIRVVLFDLGLTLIDARNRPYPNVPGALRAITAFTADDGRPVRWALVSDYTMPPAPATPAQVQALFQEYLGILAGTGLRPFFEPVARRVTISPQARATKPDRAIFATALRRLRVTVGFEQCLFITENEAHIRAVQRDLGMATLQFGAAAPAGFTDWSQAPALVATRVGPDRPANRHAAVAAHLAAHGFDLDQLTPVGGPPAPTGPAPTVYEATGLLWHPIGGAAAPGGPVHVGVPARGRVEIDADGTVGWQPEAPAADAVREAESYVTSLTANQQLAADPDAAELPPGATHQIEVDDAGRRRIVRRRFSAL